MKPRRDKTKQMHVMRLWLWSEVVGALPYLRSVIGSIREHWLAAQFTQRELDKAARMPGRPSRQQMIDAEALRQERCHAQSKFEEALVELNNLDVWLMDPLRGIALIGFRHQDDLAWYVFDLFAKRGVIGWRYDNDPIDQCRPLEKGRANGVKAPLAS